jgi:hypothetical protein
MLRWVTIRAGQRNQGRSRPCARQFSGWLRAISSCIHLPIVEPRLAVRHGGGSARSKPIPRGGVVLHVVDVAILRKPWADSSMRSFACTRTKSVTVRGVLWIVWIITRGKGSLRRTGLLFSTDDVLRLHLMRVRHLNKRGTPHSHDCERHLRHLGGLAVLCRGILRVSYPIMGPIGSLT